MYKQLLGYSLTMFACRGYPWGLINLDPTGIEVGCPVCGAHTQNGPDVAVQVSSKFLCSPLAAMYAGHLDLVPTWRWQRMFRVGIARKGMIWQVDLVAPRFFSLHVPRAPQVFSMNHNTEAPPLRIST